MTASRKVYLLTDADMERLKLAIDRDPDHGRSGGSSQHLNDAERQAHREAHRFYNFQVRRWLDEVTR